MEQDVVIIGGGPGGYTAALYCARAGLKTVLLEKQAVGGQMATAQVDNYPGFDEGIWGSELAEHMRQGAERYGAASAFGEAVKVELTGARKLVRTSDMAYESAAVVLAMGARPRELKLDAERALRGKGVSYCATCDGALFKNKTVAVVGGNNSALHDALSLSKLCSKVYIVYRREPLLASKTYLDALAQRANIEPILNTQVVGFMDQTVFKGLVLQKNGDAQTTELPCDGVFVAIGREPETTLVKGQIELDDQGYIAADESTRTSVQGVFAVGDVRTKPVRQIVTAAADGAVAAAFVEQYIRNGVR